MTSSVNAARWRRSISGLLSLGILTIIFWALFQIDLPLARFMRSVQDPVLERVGDVGTRLGSGLVLVIISVAIVLAGFIARHLDLRLAGMQSLIAHGVAALLTQVLKHSLGRPRPRLLHGNEGWPWGPSFDPGWDSFPSGHTTASFAVATVIARRFPAISWLMYATAGFVAVSRVVRGSHFPTDILAGLVLGVLVGAVIADPLRLWKQSTLNALVGMLPSLLVLFAALWLATHPWMGANAHPGMSMVGRMAIVCGLAVRLYHRLQAVSAPSYATVLIIVGLAVSTGSPLILTLVVLLCVVEALYRKEVRTDLSSGSALRISLIGASQWRRGSTLIPVALHEVPLAIGLVLAVLAIQRLSGLLPIL